MRETLTPLFCLPTCRPPVLPQVLPGAHGASQGSVVAVHRVQDLQQLSRSREERGEWRSQQAAAASLSSVLCWLALFCGGGVAD